MPRGCAFSLCARLPSLSPGQVRPYRDKSRRLVSMLMASLAAVACASPAPGVALAIRLRVPCGISAMGEETLNLSLDPGNSVK